jgi:hypothetical protein
VDDVVLDVVELVDVVLVLVELVLVLVLVDELVVVGAVVLVIDVVLVLVVVGAVVLVVEVEVVEVDDVVVVGLVVVGFGLVVVGRLSGLSVLGGPISACVVGSSVGGSGWPPASRGPAITNRPPQAVATTMRSTRQRTICSQYPERPLSARKEGRGHPARVEGYCPAAMGWFGGRRASRRPGRSR